MSEPTRVDPLYVTFPSLFYSLHTLLKKFVKANTLAYFWSGMQENRFYDVDTN
jgi:hypothetical protein